VTMLLKDIESLRDFVVILKLKEIQSLRDFVVILKLKLRRQSEGFCCDTENEGASTVRDILL
jgi:hypothetical protein